ncbi:MAG TPA: TIGR03435 family protein [Candidatus Acidoferrales bacterium]
MTRTLVASIFLLVCLGASAHAQSFSNQFAAPTASAPQAANGQSLQAMEAAGVKRSFDVVSVKLHDPADRGGYSNVPLGPGVPFPRTGGLFSVANEPLPPILAWAFDLSGDQQLRVNSQLPKWAFLDRFDIEAKAAGNPSEAEMQVMMQSALADRFKLVVHRENKEGPVFALEMVKPGKLGPQLKPHVSDPSCSDSNGAASPTCASGLMQTRPSVPGLIHYVGQNVPVSIISKYLPLTSQWGTGLDRPVLNKTGLSGNFDFSIEFARQLDPDARGPQPDQSGPTFIEALRDQLGLKLESQTGPASVLVIDHIEEASPN